MFYEFHRETRRNSVIAVEYSVHVAYILCSFNKETREYSVIVVNYSVNVA